MTREWKPGDVAAAWHPLVGEVLGIIDTDGRFYTADRRAVGISASAFENLRPLAVIDPENRKQVAHLCDALTPKRPMPVAERLHWFDRIVQNIDQLQAALREFVDPKPPEPEQRPIVHAVMYRDYKIGSLCRSGAWGAATMFSMVTDDVTCPGCRSKLDGTPQAVTP
jgi:hypothetical protein